MTHRSAVVLAIFSHLVSVTSFTISPMARRSPLFCKPQFNNLLEELEVGLSKAERYDAVLQKVCTEILGGGEDPEDPEEEKSVASLPGTTAAAGSESTFFLPLSILSEMSSLSLGPSAPTILALIDAVSSLSDPSITTQLMTALATTKATTKGGGISMWGRDMVRVKGYVNNNSVRERTLKRAGDAIPQDNRATEVGSALVFGGFVLLSLLANFFGPIFQGDKYSEVPSDFVLAAVGIGFFFDNFYAGISRLSNFVGKAPELPEIPEDWTFGRGQITGTILTGASRLVTTDFDRDCRCEAAGLMTSYLLGLPVFALIPTGGEARDLVFDGEEGKISESYVLRVLIWLMSPVAAETLKYPPPLVSSDPREADDFFAELKKDLDSLEDGDDRNELAALIDSKEGLIGWAFYQSCELLRRNYNTLEEISRTLSSGVATIGDCVAVMEDLE